MNLSYVPYNLLLWGRQTLNSKIMELTFNKAFKVTTFDVATIQKNWRIVYLPTTKEMIITKSVDKAKIARLQIPEKAGIILTKRQAPRSFPKVFTDSSAKPVNLEQRTVILRVSNEQYAFLSRFGNISGYLRQLIDEQMQNL